MVKLYRCDNCNFESDSDDAIVPWWEASRLSERLNAGDIVPYGVCPECGCFVYRYDERLMRNDAAPDLLEALRMFVALDPRCHCGVEHCGECASCLAQAAIAKAEGK